jgi:hypothetical protein
MENFMSAARPVGKYVDWIGFHTVAKQIFSATDLIPDIATIAAQYITGEERIGVFGPNFWQSKGIVAGAVPHIDLAFYEYWYGPDPVDPTRRVCDTHHRPVWIPDNLSLATVEIAGLQFDPSDTEALRQHRNTLTSGGCYAVMRKEVLGRKLPELEQIQQLKKAGYPGLPQAADVAAVLFAINQHDQSRWLGNYTGAEKRWTYTRCVERVAYGESSYALDVGGYAPSGVFVRDYLYDYDDEHIGVAALRKF